MATLPSSSFLSHSFSLSTLSLSPPTEPRLAPLSTVHSAESLDAYPFGGHHPVYNGDGYTESNIRSFSSWALEPLLLFGSPDISYTYEIFCHFFTSQGFVLTFVPYVVALLTFLPLSAFYNRNS